MKWRMIALAGTVIAIVIAAFYGSNSFVLLTAVVYVCQVLLLVNVLKK